MSSKDRFWFLDKLDWDDVESCYEDRWQAHICLLDELKGGPTLGFAQLALGMRDPAANYSADEHSLGPKILASNGPKATKRVWDLAVALRDCVDPRLVPKVIQAAGLAYCRVGVGSELSCLMQPDTLWVCNVRTLWTQIIMRPSTIQKAEEELQLYREQDSSSEIYWPTWGRLHRGLGRSMMDLIDASIRFTSIPEKGQFLWADAICNVAYVTLRAN